MANTFYIESKYAKLLGSRLPNYKHSKSDLWVFSHICETSGSRKKAKARCYIYTKGGKLFVRCHHCGYSHTFSTFLKETDPVLFDEYRLEMYKARVDSGEVTRRLSETKSEPTFDIFKSSVVPIGRDAVLNGLKSISELPSHHPAVKYVEKRSIPREFHDRIFFSSKFYKFASKFKPHFADIKAEYDHPRLILPYYDANDRVYAFTARAFGKEEPKYIFIKTDENTTNIYGLWRINPSKPVIALEGQIDSLFLDNAIAVGGADYSNVILRQLQSNLIIVPDNDFIRNAQVANQIEKVIGMGYTVSLFPEHFRHKDINDAIRAGIKPDEIRDMILLNAKSGLEAKLELSFRRKR